VGLTIRLAARLWSSLAGRLVVLLTGGMALVASVSLILAQDAHRQNIANLRIDSVVSTVEDMSTQLSIRPDTTEKLLAAGLVRHTRLPPPEWVIDRPSPKITRALQARLGVRAQALGQIKPHEYCFPRNQLAHDAETQLTWPSVPDCWLVRFADAHGQTRRLVIGLPRYLLSTPVLFDPIYLALIVVMSAALASVVAWFSIKPLRQLTRATQAFSLLDEPTPLAETGPHEVRMAIATFNLMQARVSEGHRERTGMLAAISHDLQTPLTRLQLRLDEVNDLGVRAQLGADLTIMQSIVRDGLDLARSSDNREPWSRVDIDSLLASIAADAMDLGAQVEIGMLCRLAIPTKIDAMTRCVTNLVENAVNYGGGALIECRAGGDFLAISICDRGPGIPPQDLERMFEPFARGEQSRSRATGGTGLGLTIARAQAKLFRADVSLGNRAGGGTIATLRIALPAGPLGL
jgi:signal transduction histidine kinase